MDSVHFQLAPLLSQANEPRFLSVLVEKYISYGSPEERHQLDPSSSSQYFQLFELVAVRYLLRPVIITTHSFRDYLHSITQDEVHYYSPCSSLSVLCGYGSPNQDNREACRPL